jgi:hypothetical protein
VQNFLRLTRKHVLKMFRDGTYTVWFRTRRGQGTATVHLAGGMISGGDSFFDYGGAYQIEGDRFTATLTTKRFADGPTTVLGLDEVELKLSGTLKGTIACCSGTSAQAPGVAFEATLFLNQEQAGDPKGQPGPQLQPEPPRSVSHAKIAKLPKLDSGRYRPRNPFPSGSSR